MKGADTNFIGLYVKESRLLLDAIGRDVDPELNKRIRGGYG